MPTLTLLGGYLGAGKSSLLQRMLDALTAGGRRVAVISNDFGPVNVDAEIIRTDGPLVEVTKGSMFCACKEHDFIEALVSLAPYPLDDIIVEASGLGDPSNFGTLLRQAQERWPELAHRGIICVVDSEEVLELADLLQAVPRQVGFADLILANKADLVSQRQLETVMAWLRQQNPRAEIVPTIHCDVPMDVVTRALDHAVAAPEAPTTNTAGSRLSSTFLAIDTDIPSALLRAFMDEMGRQTHRIKGIVRSEGGFVEVSGVRERHAEQAAVNPPKRLGLVLIAPRNESFNSVVTTVWERTVNLPMTLD